MQTQNKKEKILSDYQKKSDEIIHEMYKIITRAQRKVDDKSYREALEKLP